MKGGTEYARKIKKLFTRLKRKHGTPPPGEPTDAVIQALLGILHRGTTLARAERALGRLQSSMVDLNELRVSTPSELVELLGTNFPYATEKAEAIIKVLNQIFDRYNGLDLRPLVNQSKRDARQVLLELDGMDAASAAGVMLFSLDGHAIPVDEVTLAVLRNEGLVDPEADVSEVQAFLERNIPSANAQSFTTLLRSWSEDQAKRIGPRLFKTHRKRASATVEASPEPRAKQAARTAEKRPKRPAEAAGSKTCPNRPARRKSKVTRRAASASGVKRRKAASKRARSKRKTTAGR